MKRIMNKRFEFWNVIWIIMIMLVEYIIGEIWDADIWALIISVGLFLVIILLTELLHKKRFDESIKKNLNEFISDAETLLREFGGLVLEQKVVNDKIDKVDKVVLDVYRLNYYMGKLKQLAKYGDERVIDALSKGEKLWNNIKDEYASKEEDKEYIILQSAKLTWLTELINRNKENDDNIFPLRYCCAGITEKCTAGKCTAEKCTAEECTVENLIEKQRKGQKTVFIADGGYGKTWTVERMARIYAEQYMISFWTKGKGAVMSEFPVFVKVGDIEQNTDKPIFDKMKKELCTVFALETLEKEDIAFEILWNDILFVDALDEASNANINESIINEVNRYQNTVIFTTRPTDVAYLNLLSKEEIIITYHIADVNTTQVRQYLEKELSRKEKNIELTNQEIESILSNFEKSGFAEKCTSPFLLACFVNTVRETKKNQDKVFEIGENLNELYGAFIAGILERERGKKYLSKLNSVDEVLKYLNKFAITIQENKVDGLSGVEASKLAKEYFREAGFDGRGLEKAQQDINVSLREIHIFKVENGKYKFISKDFMNALMKEEQIDRILMLTSQGRIYNSNFLNAAMLKLNKILSSTEVKSVGDFLAMVYERGVSDEHAIVLLGESMASVNLSYIRDNADVLDMYELIKWIDHFENERKRLHYAYERSYPDISPYFTSWIVGKTKDVQYSKQDFEKVYEDFRFMISIIQRVNELKRHMLSLKNIEYILDAYGNNDYAKFLWLKERFTNYEYSVRKHRMRSGRYNYPKNLESVCKSIISKIDSGFEFYDQVLEIEARIKEN